MKRLFTFGCSFTNYCWPTWADIVSQDYDYYENWGKLGAGNKFIYFSLLECHQRNCITADDTVMIMWSSQAREDRYIKNKWYTPGPVYDHYSEHFLDNFVDADGYLLETVTYIQSSVNLFQSIGCNYHLLTMLPLNISTCLNNRHWLDRFIKQVDPDTTEKILKLYAPALDTVKPSIYETVFDSDWHSRDDKIIPMSLDNLYNILQKNYEDNAGESWPTFVDFFSNDIGNIPPNILKEIDEQFHLVEVRDKVKLLRRADLHPTPIEHLEYLNAIEFPITTKAKEFAKHWEELVMTNKCKWSNKLPERF